MSLYLFAWLSLCLHCQASYLIDYSNGVGRKFDGIGGLSGGGATSKLLVNYPEAQRNEILDYLFKPNFGASLQILKVEIGGDAQSTEGTESSHMHEPWDENYQRGYEWWLMVEAKKRNPDIKLYGLPWAFPGWVGKGSGSPYKYANVTANYILKWLLGAIQYYSLHIDYVGIWNERDHDIVYVETLKNLLKQNSLTANVQVVVADNGWDVSNDILKNVSFANAVDIIGCHYPGTLTTDASIKTGKPLWSSEDYSTFNDDVGAGCWARIVNQNYVNGYMTSTLSWNLIASYYQDLPYGRDGLMTAQEPWSGHYVVESPIWVTAHTTQFTEIGWSYLKHGSGVQKLDYGGSFVTFLSPDRKDITIVIETMSHNHSVCIRPDLPPYTVVAQQAVFELGGSLADIKELHVWKTELMFNEKPSVLFEPQTSIIPSHGIFTVILYPDQLYTLTTLPVGHKGSYSVPPISKPFPLPYSDDFESYQVNTEAFNYVPQVGVWEVIQSNDPAHGKVNRQVVLNDPVYWCNNSGSTINIGGDFSWSDVSVRCDILIPSINSSQGAFVAARVDRGGCDARATNGVFFTIYPSNNSFIVSSDLARQKLIVSGNFPFTFNTWYRLNLIVKGNRAYGAVDSQLLFSAMLPASLKKGFTGYGTVRYGVTDFDNWHVDSADFVPGPVPNMFVPDRL